MRSTARDPARLGPPLAAATHIFDLKCAKNFFKWCVSRRYLVASPFAEVRPIGRKKAGKPQLRIEEAKRFTDAGLQHFETTKNPLAVAALVAITMGPRASEVLNRSVRDLDNGGKILVIDSGKNERAKRRLDVPLFLQPILLELAQGREPLAKLFGLNEKGRPWRRQSLYSTVRRICKEAKVPEVCTHSLRGFWATTSVQIGTPSQAVAATLGHGSFAITERHYAAPGSRQNAGTHLVVEALRGEAPTKPSAADILAGLDARQNMLAVFDLRPATDFVARLSPRRLIMSNCVRAARWPSSARPAARPTRRCWPEPRPCPPPARACPPHRRRRT